MSEPPPIDRVAQEMSRLIMLIIRGGGRLGDFADRRLTNTQSLALTTIVNEGPLRLWALAEKMLTTDATATRTVDSLAGEGLVTRNAEPQDRRGVLISATRKGARLQAERNERMFRVVENLLTGTPDEHLVEIAGFLGDLNQRLSTGEPTAAGAPAGKRSS